MNRHYLKAAVICAGLIGMTGAASAQGRGDDGGIASTPAGSAFTYQGELQQKGSPYTGFAEFTFTLFDALAGGSQVGPTLTFEGINGLTLANGRFTVQLDFGLLPFNGDGRWLEIATRTDLGPYTTLTPRQPITAAPYALRSSTLTLPFSATVPSASDLMTITNTLGGAGYSGRLGGDGYGMVGKDNVSGNLAIIGHADYGVHGIAIGGPDYGVRGTHEASGNHGLLGTQNQGVYGFAVGANGRGVNGFGDYGVWGESPNADGRGMIGIATGAGDATGAYGVHGATGNYGRLGTAVYGVDGSVTAGIGVRGSHTPTGNFGQLGSGSGGMYAEVKGAPVAGNYAVEGERWWGSQFEGRGALCKYIPVPIGFPPWPISGGTWHAAVYGFDNTGDAAGYFDGKVIMESTGSYPTLRVVGNPASHPVASFRRFGDGQLLGFDVEDFGEQVGGVSVTGQTVSFNAFTGSHWGLLAGNEAAQRGMLMCLTGANQLSKVDDPTSEVMYGVAPASVANDRNCLGAYLGPTRPANSESNNDDPHLVMAVGNGDMWVAESGTGDLQPGDYLISSDVLGCAMKDDPRRFPVGYIVARAGEVVDWSAVESPADSSPKRTKISVFFENFVRDSRGAELAAVVEAQQREIEVLKAQVASLQTIAERLSRIEAERRAVASGLSQ